MVQVSDGVPGDPAGLLGKYANKDATPGQGVEIAPYDTLGGWEPEGVPGASRRAALALRERLWTVSSIERQRKCGKVPRSEVMEVLASPGGGFRLSGLCTCGSVWTCPICAPEIRAARGNEIALALSSRLSEGGGVTFGTGTLSHGGKHSLRSTYGLVVSAWGASREDGSVRRFREANGYLGFIRTTEVTHGDENGWHPHVHWLDFWRDALSPEQLDEYKRILYGAWSRAVVKGDRYSSPGRGLVLLPVRTGDALGNYVTEMSVTGASFELTSISTKTGRKTGKTPFQILSKVYGPGSVPWVNLWWEYEKATHGRRMLGTSRGILDALGLKDADPEPVDRGEVVALVRSVDWGRIRWFTASGLSGAQAAIERAAEGGQVGVNEAVSLLLGFPPSTVEELEPASQALSLFDREKDAF